MQCSLFVLLIFLLGLELAYILSAKSSLSSSVIVTINVEDVQDTSPLFQNLPYDVTIDENIPLRTKILTVKAVDGDRGQPNTIVYSIRSGNDDGKFLLDSSTGEVRVAKPIDRDVSGFDGVLTLTVRATELTGRQRSNTQAYADVSFDVNVNDVNDELPIFERSSYQLTLSENTPVGTPLPIRIYVSDNDQGANSDVKMSVEWKSSRLVTLSPATFRHQENVSMILIQPLDYEKKRRHYFKIFANETNYPELFNYCNIRIHVKNENDNFPIFERNHYHIYVPENASLLTSVFRVTAIDADFGRFGRVMYSLEQGNDEIKIDPHKGEIRLLKELDYESSRVKQYVINAKDSASRPLIATCLLTLSVLDVNDNPPVFSKEFQPVYVYENKVSFNISQVKATDMDYFPHNIISYKLEKSLVSDLFSIKTTEDGIGVLSLDEPLDFESIPGGKVNLTVTAFDTGNLFSSSPLIVCVQDVNDNFPLFAENLNFSVKENIGGGVLVGRIVAVDIDSGKNGEISYFVTEGRSLFASVFVLNEVTGDISTKPGTSPDFETTSRFTFQVTARDNGNPSKSTSQNFFIQIHDVNDNKPEFSSTLYHVTLNENTELADFQVRARDEDSGDNGRVLYTIEDGNSDGLFQLDEVTGNLISVKHIDYEITGSEVKLKIKAEDQGIKSLSSSAEVTITINDVNDNSPVFLRAPTLVQVPENVVGSPLGVFEAIDADSGDNSRITYSISKGNKKNFFSISPRNGELRVAREVELDREDKEFYNLTVRASDAGSNPRHRSVSVLVQVLDINDNNPEFVNFLPRVSVNENNTETEVFQLRAVDKDAGDFGVIEYSIESESDDFSIDTKTGMIRLKKALKRKVKSEHVVRVTAFDNPQNPNNSRRTEKQLMIIVNDDVEKPEFNNPLYRAFIKEEEPAGTILDIEPYPLSAKNLEEEKNANVTFTLENSTYFIMDPSTGILKTKIKIDRETLMSDLLHFTARVSDATGRYSETTITVTVLDVNDNSPHFYHSHVRKRVLENVQPGQIIARMIAYDADRGLNGKVNYKIFSGARNKFEVNAKTGEIFVAPGQYLDREKRTKYRLKVIAFDQASENPRSSTGTLVIKVGDINDSRPKFLTPHTKTQVSENSKVGTEVARIKATDPDLNSNLVYYMTSVSIFGIDGRPLVLDEDPTKLLKPEENFILDWFCFDPETGKIALNSSRRQDTTVDRELCSSVLLKFRVRDRASLNEEVAVSLEEASVQLEITDVNDNSPVLTILTRDVIASNAEILSDIQEEIPIGSKVFTVTAMDLDQGENGQVCFEMDDLTDELLSLENNCSGIVTSSARIDREVLAPFGGFGWINFTLIARDQGSSVQQTSKLLVRLRVNDNNDNYPRFRSSFYETIVMEDLEVGSSVTQVRADDPDDADFGDVTYRLHGDSNHFGIDPNTGHIFLSEALDYERTKQHLFFVIARDKGTILEEHREASVEVTITIGDVNDNRPVFVQPMQKLLVISENTVPGTSIVMVSATDADEGNYGHVTYRLLSSKEFFSVNLYNGLVTLSHHLIPSWVPTTARNLTIAATDGGGKESKITIQIKVLDVNDHTPIFTHPKSDIIRISEEKSAGYFVAQVNASDDDVGLNGNIRYKLYNLNSQTSFFINEVTGRIVTSRKLDREIQPTFTLTIEARDLGSPSLYSVKTLIVQLDDIDDNKPFFQQSQSDGATQTLSIKENAPIGCTVGHVTPAIDRDQDAKIFYYILSEGGRKNNSVFAIKKNRVFLQERVNREKQDRFSLIIGASNYELNLPISKKLWDQSTYLQQKKPSFRLLDPGPLIYSNQWNPSRDRSLLRLTILVDDVIDEAPRFNQRLYVTAVVAETLPGTKILQMRAVDNDLNDVVTYSITESIWTDSNVTINKINDFKINLYSGVLTTSSRLSNQERFLVFGFFISIASL